MSSASTPPSGPSEDDFPPQATDGMPPQFPAALKQMSRHSPVIDVITGKTVAEGGQGADLVGCLECARAVGQGWWGSIARHAGAEGAPVCRLCGEGQATLTAQAWFEIAGQLAAAATANGSRRSWRDDAVKGQSARTL